ncbi:hypothetical protein [Stenotrophomonas phage vB_SmeS_BUCT700]|uniref:O-spanin n=1 Tax=Stenotrophomonas phage vB_SmeS_BUCT700 TaxID=2924895 RepID=A0AAE9G6J8_9CAUD|nr:hypothetical protein [Stenotrophomonas phage vB_SmeS_BUCT700]
MLCLMMLLTSCASIKVPASLLRDCEIPYLRDGVVTNKDVVDLAIEREFALRQCNVQMEGIRVFVKKHPKMGVDKDS